MCLEMKSGSGKVVVGVHTRTRMHIILVCFIVRADIQRADADIVINVQQYSFLEKERLHVRHKPHYKLWRETEGGRGIMWREKKGGRAVYHISWV